MNEGKKRKKERKEKKEEWKGVVGQVAGDGRRWPEMAGDGWPKPQVQPMVVQL